MVQVVIRAMTHNIDLSSYTGVQNDVPFETFSPSDISTLHALLLTIPDNQRAIVYKKKVVDTNSGTWSWCFYLLGNGTPSSIVSKSRKSPRYSKNGYGNNVTFEEYSHFTEEQKNAPFTTLISDSNWCSELDTNATAFNFNEYEHWQNYGVLVNKLGTGHMSNFLCGNIKTNMVLSKDISNDTPFFGMPLEQMRNWDTSFDYYKKPNFYNGRYHTYSPELIYAVSGRINGVNVLDTLYTDNMLLYDQSNPLKKTSIGERFSPYGYKENDYDTTTKFATYQDYISFMDTNRGNMVKRKNTSYSSSTVYKYYNFTDYAFTGSFDASGIAVKGLVGDYDSASLTNLFVPCGNWYFDNVYVSSDYDACKEYIDTGKVPHDAYIHHTNPDGTTDKSPHDDDNPSNDDTDGSKRENQAENNPTIGGITCGAVNYYYMPEQQVKAFFNWFWNNSPSITDVVNNYVTGIYNNLSEMITGLYYFPCEGSFLASSFGQGNIQIGRYPSGISAVTITGLPKNVTLATKKIEPYFNSFLDYEGYTKIQLYLPYFGIVDLPTNTVMGTTLAILCAVDITSCTMSYIVKSGGAIVFETSVPFGLNLPISLSSSMEKATNTLNSVIGLGSSIATTAVIAKAEPILGAMNLANTATNFHSPVPDITVKGNTTSFSGQWQPQKCALIIQRPITAVPSNYGSKVGYCLNKAYQLSRLDGFTKCNNPQITFTDKKPLKTEQEEIYNLLERGVIL